MVALGYIVVGLALIIALGWFYAVLSVVVDLMAAWRETCRRVMLPRQFGLRALFSLVAIVAITCFVMQGDGNNEVAHGLVMSAVALPLAAAIVYAYNCMFSEWARPSSQEQAARLPPSFSAADSATTPLKDDTPDVELNRWLAKTSDEANTADGAKSTSTEAVRSHFRVHLTVEVKGTRAAGFGRF